MKKWIKMIAGFLGVMLLLIVFAAILLVTLVNPNRFKPLIAEEIKKQTGRELNISGDLSWSFYPYLGVKVGHTEFHNPPGFQQKIFAELSSATLSVQLLPLLHARIQSDGILVDGLTINLIKNAAGLKNWQGLLVEKSDATPATTSSAIAKSPGKMAGLAMAGITISNANIYWIDEQTKQTAKIEHLDLSAKEVSLNHPFPLTAQFHFVNAGATLSGDVNLTSRISFYPDKQFYQFENVDLSADIHRQGKKFKFDSKTNMVVDMATQRIEFQRWQGELAGVKWSGKLEVKKLTNQPFVTGYVQTQPFVLQTFLTNLGEQEEVVPKANQVTMDINFNVDTAKQTTALQKVTFTGLIKANDLQLKKITASDLVVQTRLENGVLNLSPISALFYQGNLQGAASINLNNATPDLTMMFKLTNVQTEPLLTDLASTQAIKFAGAANVVLQLTTVGADRQTMLSNLNGNSQFSLNNGVMKGIDIGYWAESAYAVVKKQPVTLNNTNQTQLGSLTGKATIHNGVIMSDDLLLDSTHYTTKGKGSIDLVNQQIDYLLEAAVKQSANDKKELSNLYGLTIPIRVNGNLNQPKIGIEVSELAKQITKEQIDRVKDNALKKIQQRLNEKSPGAGDALKNILGASL